MNKIFREIDSETKAIDNCRLNKMLISKFPEGYSEPQIPEEDPWTQRLKRCDDNSKDEGISSTVNLNSLSQTFKQNERPGSEFP